MKRIFLTLLTLLTLAPMGANALDNQTPCVAEPYDYQYKDDSKQILIEKIAENGITYFVADVQLAEANQFQTALSADKPFGDLEKLSKMASRNGAVLAVNDDDYGTHKFGTIIRNGKFLRAHDTTRHMLIVDKAGDFSVRVDRADENPQELGRRLVEEGVRQTLEFGPELVREGQAVKPGKEFDLISRNPSRREPRTGIGQIGPLHYIVIVADGRQDGYSKGMTLPELQKLFIRYGAQTAINLDGGGSSEMWFMGEIINSPAGGKERPMSDAIFF